MLWLAGWVVMTGALTMTVVVTKTDGSSTLVAVMVYVPAVLGEVHTLSANEPLEAVHVRVSVTPPLAVALKLCLPGATVELAGVMGVMVTWVGVTLQVAVAVALEAPVTVSV